MRDVPLHVFHLPAFVLIRKSRVASVMVVEDFPLAGKIVVVTGGGSGTLDIGSIISQERRLNPMCS